MFWKINFRQPSAIDGLLEKEDCTLTEILDEDDVLQESKTQNKKLVDFLCRPENLQQLVQYICNEPSVDDEDKVRFKYPHLACEILTAEIFSIMEALTSSDMYLPMLWNFLDYEPPMNPLVGSFISKVLMMILNQRTPVFLDYIRKREGFMDSFLKHLGTSAIMDLLLQMIVANDGDQSKLDLAVWLKGSGVIEKLLDCIHPSSTVDQCINASQAICDMIRISRDASQMTGPSPLLATLENEETIERLLNNMFATDDPPDWAIVNGIMILLTTLEKRISNSYSPTFGTQPEENSASSSSWDQAIEKTLTALGPRVKQFHNLLHIKPPLSDPVLFTVGKLDPPLGNMRLRVVQLFSTLLQSQDVRIQREVIRHKTCSVLLDLFFQYPWNNFLHTYVELCITSVLTMATPVPLEMNDVTGQSDGSITLRQHLLTECNLVQRLLQGAEVNEKRINEDRGCRQGYMGHLIRLANQIAGNTRALSIGTGSLPRTRDDSLALSMEEGKLQEELDEETYQRWAEFISGQVADMNKKNSTNLGGTRPMNSSMDDSDEEYDPLNMAPDNELEKAFQQYQELHFTNQFMEEFGTNDDLNPSAISYASAYSNITSITCSISADEDHTQYMAAFDAASSERIQQFDDESESDEEESSTWVEKDLSFTSPGDHQSQISTSGEEEEGGGAGRRRFPTESSDDDDDAGVSEKRRKPLIIEEKQTSNGSSDLGVIWSSEFSTDEDLSGVKPIETSGGAMDWTQEPPANSSTTGDSSDNWANFGDSMNPPEGIPSAVTTAYVSVSELEGRGERLSSDGSDDIIDQNLLLLQGQGGGVERSSSESSEDEQTSSSDEERSGSYQLVGEGDSGNPLIDSSPSNTPTTTKLNSETENEDKELTENYRFLSRKGLLSDNKKTPNTKDTKVNCTDDEERSKEASEQNPVGEDCKTDGAPEELVSAAT